MEKEIITNVRVGNDIGNSEHDIVINGILINQPNIFSTTKDLPNLDEINPEYIIENINDNLIVTINSPSCSPAIYYIGNNALNSGKTIHNMEVGLFNDKVNSDIVIINTLAQIAGYTVKKVFKRDPESINSQLKVFVDMATSLPVTQYNKSAAEKLSEKFLKGKHNVIVHVGNHRVDVDIIFEYVKVLPESVSVVFALQKMDGNIFEEFNTTYNQKINGSYFINKRILHGSIGEGTTEYPITEDIEFNPNFIKGSNNGIGLAIEAAMENFLKDVHLRTYSRQNFSAALKKHDHKYHDKAYYHIEEPLETEAQAILHNLKVELEKANNEVDVMCIHGGGSILMKSKLHSKLIDLCNKADIKLFYVPEQYAVILEALGLYEFTSGDIFESLKKKSTGREVLKLS